MNLRPMLMSEWQQAIRYFEAESLFRQISRVVVLGALMMEYHANGQGRLAH